MGPHLHRWRKPLPFSAMERGATAAWACGALAVFCLMCVISMSNNEELLEEGASSSQTVLMSSVAVEPQSKVNQDTADTLSLVQQSGGPWMRWWQKAQRSKPPREKSTQHGTSLQEL